MARTGFNLPVDPLNELGDPEAVFKGAAQLTFMRTLIEIIRVAFSKFISRETAAPFILLQAPGGAVFRITVADDGSITATNVRGAQAAAPAGGSGTGSA